MDKIKFTVEGVEGDFYCDADEFRNYKTLKQLARSKTNAAGSFDALERIFMGNDEEYVERVGGASNLEKLVDSAAGAVGSKN